MKVAGSDPDHVVARGANDATSSPPSEGMVDSDKVLTQLRSYGRINCLAFSHREDCRLFPEYQ